MGQAGEDVAQVGVGIDLTPTAAFDHRVNNRAAFARPGVADEEPVFLADGGGPNGVFAQVMPPPDLCRVAKLEAHIRAIPEPVGCWSAA